MVICGTGHRANKLGGYDKDTFLRLIDFIWKALEDIRPTVVISGMDLGFDQALARAAMHYGADVHAYVPCYEHSSKWPPASQRYYAKLLDSAKEVRYTHDGPYPGPWVMQERNIEMVNDAEAVLALWNGSDGGTANCIAFAEKSDKTIVNLWNEWIKS